MPRGITKKRLINPEDSKPVSVEVRLYRIRTSISTIPFSMLQGDNTTQDNLTLLLRLVEHCIAGLTKNQPI